MKEECGNCLYFLDSGLLGEKGDCRFYPPRTFYSVESVLFFSRFPEVNTIEWCGKWNGFKKSIPSVTAMGAF